MKMLYAPMPNMTIAQKIAHEVIKQKLAICVNIIPQVVSIYEWQGKICEDHECVLLCKTHDSQANACAKYIESNHTYEIPLISTIDIIANEKYQNWANSLNI